MRAELWALCFIGYGAITTLTVLTLWGTWRRRQAARQMAAPEEPRDYDDWSVSDTRPYDIDVCSACKGTGEVVISRDFETGALNLDRCYRCRPHQEGVDPAQVPGWVLA